MCMCFTAVTAGASGKQKGLSAQCNGIRPNSGSLRPKLLESGRNSGGIAQSWPDPTENLQRSWHILPKRQTLVDFGRNRAKFGRARPGSVQSGCRGP